MCNHCPCVINPVGAPPYATIVCVAGAQPCERICHPPRVTIVCEASAEPCELCKVVTPLSSVLYAFLDIYQPTYSSCWPGVEDLYTFLVPEGKKKIT